ncbi:MAG TPA: UvrD-helicase domain-containing protein, partial [Candidatus Eremiobacteraceae bacterium]|nr:UvrD-helicase domain-containing protein [Candidatus Eremiobacteraceae bacterium]
MKSATPELSGEQQQVVAHELGPPALVDAGAGTGKTHTIVHRVEALHRGGRCPAEHILLLTFAKKAAAELRRRVVGLLGPLAEPPHCSTFHSFANEIIERYAYDLGISPDATVVEEIDARLIFRKVFRELERAPGNALAALPLRAARRAELLGQLYAIVENLKTEGISIDAFRERAVAAAKAVPSSFPYRAIRPRGARPGSRKADAETTDFDLA